MNLATTVPPQRSTPADSLFLSPPRPPQGAIRTGDQTSWTLWAPKHDAMTLVLNGRDVDMEATGDGYFRHAEAAPEVGARYSYRLPGGQPLPDPASRWQPDGVHDPSAVYYPNGFDWRHEFAGLPMKDYVLYEMHVGAFTNEGTFAAAAGRLDDLVDLGITAIEVMPVAQFPGARGWGYDGVYPYAVQQSYGGPRAFQEFIDACHGKGLAVVLDVVYNHLGPEGNYLSQFGPYFTERYHTPWGAALNYDDRDSDAVRRFVIDNAVMWVRDYRVDGLRLDAVHAIYDMSAYHLLAEIAAEVDAVADASGRVINVIAESDQNDPRITAPPAAGGFGLQGVWTDDLHHAVHTIVTGESEGYYADFGTPRHLAKALESGYIYDGVYSPYRRRRQGGPAGDVGRERFVACVQNHDQVGNRAVGDRFGTLLSPEAQRCAAALLLLAPHTPMLWMGEEYGETNPFPFFCSFGDPALIEAVREGRKREFAELEFQWGEGIPDPHAESTFDSAKLNWDWSQAPHAGLRKLYRDLIAARKTWAALVDDRHAAAAVSDNSSVLHLVREAGGERVTAFANLSETDVDTPADYAPDRVLLSTAGADYGGPRAEGDYAGPLRPWEVVVQRDDGRKQNAEAGS